MYNASDPSPAPESGGTAPSTLYGVYKLANEGTARVFWHDDGVGSIGIRPYVVYGPGRDQGMTSGPTLAMAAAARGEGFEIAYGGTAQYDFAPDVGRSSCSPRGPRATARTSRTSPARRPRWMRSSRLSKRPLPRSPGPSTYADQPLPFPESLESGLLERLVGPLPRTSLADGVRETVGHFRKLSAAAGEARPAR